MCPFLRVSSPLFNPTTISLNAAAGRLTVEKSAYHHLSQNEIAGDNPYPVELKFPASLFTQT
jgi:hypothetical protein